MPRITPIAHENATGDAKNLLDVVKSKRAARPTC